ncbi:MAG: hypothetical protein EIB84_05760 [Spiroplasma poulsonii]|uniref:Uncharacterized protein n=2 Tax=Spiroplasma poulsonii TaxID=2138 RepID=A0A2P6FDW4_9MOLU|nr:hypothetical protein [Spiroplasma poulsonii]KAF0850646.1 hypothetical protein MSROBK_015340 [Spiroplasma poulsonii]MBW1242281.1 hypothetical protein [Spiroplasma poulsonii]PQM31657.1 hypothetical protein SMSRO_SF015060 [Spiroplasma poulsonii]PWF96686.1 hypothetical protein SMSE_21330 [Spiroplasma poulsonii]PWF97261.1 hypothetical protein SMH99_20700 [Spiroplasma poulsonii]
MPIYIEIFKQIKTQDITINIMFDKDNGKSTIHQKFNEYIINNADKVLAFNKNLEFDTKFTTNTKSEIQNKYKCVEFAEHIDNNVDLEQYKFCKE